MIELTPKQRSALKALESDPNVGWIAQAILEAVDE